MPIKNQKKLISSLKSRKNFHLLKEKPLKTCFNKPGKLKDFQKKSLKKRLRLQNKLQKKRKRVNKLQKNKFSTLKIFLNLLVEK